MLERSKGLSQIKNQPTWVLQDTGLPQWPGKICTVAANTVERISRMETRGMATGRKNNTDEDPKCGGKGKYTE